MTEKQWEEIGALADYKYVDFSGEGVHAIHEWAEEVKKLGYITEDEVQEIHGGWEPFFWEACEWA